MDGGLLEKGSVEAELRRHRPPHIPGEYAQMPVSGPSLGQKMKRLHSLHIVYMVGPRVDCASSLVRFKPLENTKPNELMEKHGHPVLRGADAQKAEKAARDIFGFARQDLSHQNCTHCAKHQDDHAFSGCETCTEIVPLAPVREALREVARQSSAPCMQVGLTCSEAELAEGRVPGWPMVCGAGAASAASAAGLCLSTASLSADSAIFHQWDEVREIVEVSTAASEDNSRCMLTC